MSTISIDGLDRVAVFQALYDNAKVLGMGAMHATSGPLSRAEALQEMGKSPELYFDYVRGRVMKVDLSSTELHPALYDRDNGPGAVQRVISDLRQAD